MCGILNWKHHLASLSASRGDYNPPRSVVSPGWETIWKTDLLDWNEQKICKKTSLSFCLYSWASQGSADGCCVGRGGGWSSPRLVGLKDECFWRLSSPRSRGGVVRCDSSAHRPSKPLLPEQVCPHQHLCISLGTRDLCRGPEHHCVYFKGSSLQSIRLLQTQSTLCWHHLKSSLGPHLPKSDNLSVTAKGEVLRYERHLMETLKVCVCVRALHIAFSFIAAQRTPFLFCL